MAIVKPTPEELAEREELKRLRRQYVTRHPIPAMVKDGISLSVARELGYYEAILLAYLEPLQREYENYGDTLNKRQGKKWIPTRSYELVCSEIPLIPDSKAVQRAAKALEDAGYILTEATGAFLEADHQTGRKRDKATWWHVVRGSMADAVPLSVSEAQKYGIPAALIIAHWRGQPEAQDGHRKLSAVEIENALPMDERTARRKLKDLLAAGVLEAHPTKPKLYVLAQV